MLKNSVYAVIGGAGFIGSHFVTRLLSNDSVVKVVVIDNFSSGSLGHLSNVSDNHRLDIVNFDLGRGDDLSAHLPIGCTVIHLASNPDIALSMVDPTIDFFQGTMLTHEVVEAARLAKCKTILYASGSGVYGDYGNDLLVEGKQELKPVSTYGASKLAGEALVCSYANMFGIRGIAFRFGNVIGASQTHGVGFDFVRKLKSNPSVLNVLGDGSQSKTYIHVEDVVEAVLLADAKFDGIFSVFNVGTDQYSTVKEIVELAIEVCGTEKETKVLYQDSPKGWKGDVPIMRLSTEKIRNLGWSNKHATKDALKFSLQSMWSELTSSESL